MCLTFDILNVKNAWYQIIPSGKHGTQVTPNGAMVWDGNGWLALVDDDSDIKPPPPKTESWKQEGTTLFVGVSSFRDKRCVYVNKIFVSIQSSFSADYNQSVSTLRYDIVSMRCSCNFEIPLVYRSSIYI